MKRRPWFLRNLWLKVAALVLASILWGAAQGFRSVEETLDIPVSLQRVPEDVVVVSQSAREVNVRLRGSRAALRRASKELGRYTVLLESAQAPEYRHAVSLEAFLPRGASTVFRSPSTIVVKLEPRVSKRVPVKADVVGSPAEGFDLGKVSLDPAEVVLEGAESEVRRIRQVMTDRLDLSSAREGFADDVGLLLDARNVWLRGSRERVRVTIEIVPRVPGEKPRAPGPRGG